MNIIQPQSITLAKNSLAWMAQLGNALSGVGSLIQAGFGVAAGVNAIPKGNVSQMSIQMGGQIYTSPYFPSHHTGGKSSGKDEVLAILRFAMAT